MEWYVTEDSTRLLVGRWPWIVLRELLHGDARDETEPTTKMPEHLKAQLRLLSEHLHEGSSGDSQGLDIGQGIDAHWGNWWL